MIKNLHKVETWVDKYDNENEWDKCNFRELKNKAKDIEERVDFQVKLAKDENLKSTDLVGKWRRETEFEMIEIKNKMLLQDRLYNLLLESEIKLKKLHF